MMNGKLNEAQLEILKMFSHDLSEDQLMRFKKHLMEFKLQELSQALDRYMELENKTFDDLLNEHMRTPYKAESKAI